MISSFVYEDDLMISLTPIENDNGRSYGDGYRGPSDPLPFIEDKIRMPLVGDLIERPRLDGLLADAADRYGTNLISGRAKTGKSTAAAAFARAYARVAWYRLDPADIAWPAFSRYLAASVLETTDQSADIPSADEHGPADADSIARFLIRLLPNAYTGSAAHEPMLIVLDDVHHIFDASWFQNFFDLLLHSLPSSVHLLMVCRGKPPFPLWRLRSKQLINIIDEKVLAFTRAETEKLCRSLGVSHSRVLRAHDKTFGRVGKILEFAAEEPRRRSRVRFEKMPMSVT